MVIRLADTVSIERIGFYKVCPCREILPMYVFHHIRAGQDQKVVIALQRHRRLNKTLAPKISFRQAIALNHRAHGTVQNKNTLLYRLL